MSNTYDVFFNDDNYTNAKGFENSLEYCKDYIATWNGTATSYFKEYKGGIVSVVSNETGETFYQEEVK